jgi:hypothetical protein
MGRSRGLVLSHVISRVCDHARVAANRSAPFSDSQSIVTDTLDDYALPYEVQKKRIVKYGEEQVFS